MLNYQIVIPARGGSKRLPRKNIINFGGKPLIAHTIEFAIESFEKTKIWVNTDDEEIKEIAKQFKVNVTLRPSNLGSDTSSTVDVLRYQCDWFKNNKIKCDAIILLQATNPIRPIRLIEDAIGLFEKVNRGSLASFSVLNKKYGTIDKNYFKPQNYSPGQRMQEIFSSYFENGLIYITKVNHINNGSVITDDVYPLVYDGIESKVDIDEIDDLLFANFVFEKINNKI